MKSVLQKSVETRARFIAFSVVAVGIPMSAAFILWFDDFAEPGSIGFAIFLAIVAIGGSILWGFVMWYVFVLPTRASVRSEIERAKRSASNNEAASRLGKSDGS